MKISYVESVQNGYKTRYCRWRTMIEELLHTNHAATKIEFDTQTEARRASAALCSSIKRGGLNDLAQHMQCGKVVYIINKRVAKINAD